MPERLRSAHHPRFAVLAAAVAVALAFAPAVPGHAAAADSTTLYAAPDGAGSACTQAAPCALTGAQGAARTATSDGRDVTVVLADGTYRRSSTWSFGPADSGSPGHPVVWTAAAGAHPVISGGVRADGWQEIGRSGVWKAHVPAGTATRQLYVDGQDAPVAQATPAQLGLSLSDWDADGFTVTGATAAWFTSLAAQLRPAQLRQVQFSWTPMRPTDWEESECPLAAVEGTASSAHLTMAQPCWNNLTNKSATVYGGNTSNVTPYSLAPGSAPTMIENARPLLHAGQWYLDQKAAVLYYQPDEGQDPAALDVEVPRVESLLTVTGTLRSPVHDLTFRGLTFSTATWNEPSSDIGFAQVQDGLHVTQPNVTVDGVVQPATQGECRFATPNAGSCPWASFAQPLANVQLSAARRVSFLDDSFTDLGAVGLGIKYGSRDNLVRGSSFSRIGSSAIWLGCSGDPTPGSDDDPAATVIADCAADPDAARGDDIGPGGADEILTGTRIDNNVLHDAGIDYAGAAGITLMFTQHTTITHNDIFDMPYDGITSGAWQGHVDTHSPADPDAPVDEYYNTTTNINADNAIDANWFHHNMQRFGDGGDIYTEGQQGRTVYAADGSIDRAASYAHGLTVRGNVADTDTPNYSYFYAPDVGSQWATVTGNVEWNSHYSMSSHWPLVTDCYTDTHDNWFADPDDSPAGVCLGANAAFPEAPGPDSLTAPIDGVTAKSVVRAAGPRPRYAALEAALPASVTYIGTSPASGHTPARALVAGSGLTADKAVFVDGAQLPARDVTRLSTGFLVVALPPGADPSTLRVGAPG